MNFIPHSFLSIFISGLRLIATFTIFWFHLCSLNQINDYNLDFFAILIFCFLSGYLSSSITPKNRNPWIKKRILSILIPYWLVILPALAINRIIEYKQISLTSYFITILGGNMFLETKVYVIAWYITFVLLLYLFIYFQSFVVKKILNIGVWCLGVFIFASVFNKFYYFISFSAGFAASTILSPPPKIVSKENSIQYRLFKLQAYSYDFFLVHGGVLLFFTALLKVDMGYAFFYGLILSIILSIILHNISIKMIRQFL